MIFCITMAKFILFLFGIDGITENWGKDNYINFDDRVDAIIGNDNYNFDD